MKMFYSCDIYMRTIVWRNICHADISRIFDLFTYVMKSRDSSVGIALCYGLDDREFSVPAVAGNFSLHHRVQTGSEAHPASYPMGTRGSFPGGKAAETCRSQECVELHLQVPPTRLQVAVLS